MDLTYLISSSITGETSISAKYHGTSGVTTTPPTPPSSQDPSFRDAKTQEDRFDALLIILAELGVQKSFPNTARVTTDAMQGYMVYRYGLLRMVPLRYNLFKTTISLVRSLQFLLKVVQSGGHVLVVAGSSHATYAWSSVEDREDYKGLSFSTRPSRLLKKWPGGLFTNFMAYLTHSLPFVNESGEGIGSGHSRVRYESTYGAMKYLCVSRKRPSVVIFMNAKESKHGVLECAKCSVPSIGFVTQDCSSTVVDNLDYVIAGSLDTMEINMFYMDRILWVISLGQNSTVSWNSEPLKDQTIEPLSETPVEPSVDLLTDSSTEVPHEDAKLRNKQ